jgi:hypothetical protein
MKSYDLHTTFASWFLTWGMAIISLPFFALIFFLLLRDAEDILAWPIQMGIVVLWLGLMAWFALKKLAVPRVIELHEDGTVKFRGLVGERSVHAHDIESIQPTGNEMGYLVVKHTGGKISLINQFNEFHDFLISLKRHNPTVELKGC